MGKPMVVVFGDAECRIQGPDADEIRLFWEREVHWFAPRLEVLLMTAVTEQWIVLCET